MLHVKLGNIGLCEGDRRATLHYTQPSLCIIRCVLLPVVNKTVLASRDSIALGKEAGRVGGGRDVDVLQQQRVFLGLRLRLPQASRQLGGLGTRLLHLALRGLEHMSMFRKSTWLVFMVPTNLYAFQSDSSHAKLNAHYDDLKFCWPRMMKGMTIQPSPGIDFPHASMTLISLNAERY